MKGKFNLNAKFKNVLIENRYISEITLAELKFGVENSAKQEKNRKALEDFLKLISVFTEVLNLEIRSSLL